MRWLVAALLAITLAIQFRLWISQDGVREVTQLKAAVAVQREENARLKQRNDQLAAEVRDLKQGFSALEERARNDLGMIAPNETYFQVVPKMAPAGTTPPESPPTRTAAR